MYGGHTICDILEEDDNYSHYKRMLAASGFIDSSSGATPFMNPFSKYVTERVSPSLSLHNELTYQSISSKESARPLQFSYHLFLETQDSDIIINKFKETQTVCIYLEGEKTNFKCSKIEENQYVFEAPSDDVWTVQAWVLEGVSESDDFFANELASFKEEMDMLLDDFNSGKPLVRPKELIQLAEKIAAEATDRELEDIKDWAESLAEDISKLTD